MVLSRVECGSGGEDRTLGLGIMSVQPCRADDAARWCAAMQARTKPTPTGPSSQVSDSADECSMAHDSTNRTATAAARSSVLDHGVREGIVELHDLLG
jgi:hypothetical protein